MKSYILRQDFQHRYNSAFQEYVIDKMFGGDILLGSDVVNEDVEIDERDIDEKDIETTDK